METINNFNVVELDAHLLSSIDGGKTWGESLGYACGYLFGAATNAAEILGNTIAGGLLSKAIGL